MKHRHQHNRGQTVAQLQYLQSIRPRVQEIAASFVENLNGSTGFFMDQMRIRQPEMFRMMGEEVRRLPRSPNLVKFLNILRVLNGER